mmetsp:Transcript_114543/g.355729  ORF Transcript_114543/g.355729 Transcript_114543/m.355729 type:complete len:358 (+) Transcript_114543:85-1158(+)
MLELIPTCPLKIVARCFMLLIPCVASLRTSTKAESAQSIGSSSLLEAYEASQGNPMDVSLMYAASKEVDPLPNLRRDVSSFGCMPTIVIAGMARSGTSHMRYFLSTFNATHVGRDSEDWSLGLSEKSSASQHWASNYQCKAFPSKHRVASYPWLFASDDSLYNTAQNAPKITYVLILRDPVERFISSYYHLAKEERRKDLPLLTNWANYAHRSNRFAFADLHAAVGKRSVGGGKYYTMNVEEALHRVLLQAKGRRLMVGVLEDLQPLKEKLVKTFKLSAMPQGVILGDAAIKDTENNVARRDELPLPKEVISAVAKTAQAETNFARVAGLISQAGTPMDDWRLRYLWHHTSGVSHHG